MLGLGVVGAGGVLVVFGVVGLVSLVGWLRPTGSAGRVGSGGLLVVRGLALGGALAGVLAGGLVWGAASGLALDTHVLERSFASEGEGAGQVKNPEGVAVDEESGVVFVADAGNRRVDEFSEAGDFILAFGRDVNANPVAADRDVCLALETCQAGAAGTGPGAFETPEFVAVDGVAGGEGDVYVGDIADRTVSKFTPEGAVVESWGEKGQLKGSPTGEGGALVPFGTIVGITVTPTGLLAVLENSAFEMFEFERSDGAFKTSFETPRPSEKVPGRGLAVNAKGEFFKENEAGDVEQLGAEGTDVGQVSLFDNNSKTGLGVDAATGDLYVDDEGRLVEHFAFNGSGEVLEEDGASCVVKPNPEELQQGFGCGPSDSFGLGGLQGGTGVAVGAGHGVFVADATRMDVFVPATLPDVKTSPPTEARAHTATLNGTVKPDGFALTECVFEYVEAAGFQAKAADPYAAGHTVPCVPAAGEIPTGGETPVHADIAGLQPDVVYHYRLLAGNAKGPNTGADESFTTPGSAVEAESASEVSDDSASLQANLEPNNTPLTYFFEYSTSSTEACTPGSCPQIPAEPISVPAGKASVEVDQPLQGLQPATVYHYRVVVVSELPFGAEEFTGPDQTFRTHATGEFVLPDHRQWEMVSPPEKEGALIEPIGEDWVIQAAADGHAITYLTDTPTETEPAGSPLLTQVLSTRTSEGWQTRDLTVPHAKFTDIPVGTGQEYRFFSQDLSVAAVQPFGPFIPCTTGLGEPQTCISPEASEQTPFLQDTTSGTFTPLVTGCPEVGPCPKPVEEHTNVPPGTVFGAGESCTATAPCGPGFDGGSPDLSHVVFGSSNLTATSTPEGGLYERSADAPLAEQLRLVSLLPPNEAGEAAGGWTVA